MDYWAPLYCSEGPFQAGMVMLKYLDLKLEGMTETGYKNFFLSYDNMHFGVTICLYSLLSKTRPS